MMKHPNIDELLELRDGKAPPWVGAHVADCASCHTRVDEFHHVQQSLRDLDEVMPERDLWPQIAASAGEHVHGSGRRWLLTAAAILLFFGAAGLLVNTIPNGSSTQSHHLTANQREELDNAINDLVAASNDMESILREYALSSRVVEVRDAVRIADLEDRIALVDAQLASVAGPSINETEALLWVDRVELLDALIEVHTTTVGNPAIRYANSEQPGGTR